METKTKEKTHCYKCGEEITKKEGHYMRIKEDPKPGSGPKAPLCNKCFRLYQD